LATQPRYNQKELLRRIAQDDAAAFRILFDELSPKINAYAISLTRSTLLAEEIVQEVFAAIWAGRHATANISNIEAWLVTLARNTGSSMLRRLAREKLIIHELQYNQPEVSEAYNDEWKEYHTKLITAIRQLPPQQQKVWIMSRQQGIRQHAIADELGISVYTVKEYLKKATATLKKQLTIIIFWGIPSFFLFIRLLN
jgi:RNA polymerase sigma-70 factor (family 1)